MSLTWQTFNFGSYTNIGDADDLKTAFTKTDNNLNYLKQRLNTFSNTDINGNALLIVDGNDIKIKTIETANSNTTITVSDNSIILNVNDSINSLNEDETPTLSANLNTNGFEIFNKDINNEYKNLKLNDLLISTTDGSTELYSTNILLLNSDDAIKFGANIDASGKSLECNSVMANVLSAPNITSNMVTSEYFIGNVSGDLNGTTTGNHVGDVSGNVSGYVSAIDNHSVKHLNDVSDNDPVIDQLLVWSGTEYVPTTLSELTVKYPVRLPQMAPEDMVSLSPLEGDMIYNVITKKFQGFSNGSWVDLH